MTDVVVVGAGPTGLTLGCLLRRYGMSVRVLDRLPEPAPLAKAMVIWSRSLEILDEIGVAADARAASVALESARYVVDDRTVAAVRANTVPDTEWQPVILPQGDLERLLRARLEMLGGHVEWDSGVTGLREIDGGVRVEVGERDGRSRAVDARFVVGCDGLRSAVRGAAGVEWTAGTEYEEVFQLGDVDADTELDRTQVSHFLGRSGVSVTIPMPQGRWRVVGYLDGEKGPDRPDAAALQRLLTECGHTGTTITNVHWSGTFRVVRRLAQTFRQGRVLLAGDAAHVHSPAGGQGLNTGIQDAHNLAWKLALVARGQAGEQLLDSYTDERRPVAKRILTLTQLQDSALFGARSAPSRLLRDSVLRALSRAGVLERRLIPDLAQLLVSYRSSRLSVGNAPAGSVFRPGRRFPNLSWLSSGQGEPVRLPAAADGPAVTLLAAPGRRPVGDLSDVRATCARYTDTVRLCVLAEPLPDIPAPRRQGYLLGLRPDGHVGYRGPLAATPALKAWLHDALALVARLDASAPAARLPWEADIA